jgi:hypothetical protein
MKKYYFIIIVALILGLVLTGCTLLSNIGQAPATEQSGITYLTKNGPPIPSTSLVGLWHFDGDALDSSGNDNDGDVYGATAGVPGKFGNALNFDGVDDYASIPHSTSLDISSVITVEAWIKADTLGSQNAIIRKGLWDTAVIKSWGLDIQQIGGVKKARFFIYDGTMGYLATSGAITTGTWHHLAGTYDGTTVDIYLDGDNVLSTSVNYVGDIDTNTEGIVIGMRNDDCFFDGLIDEVRIWKEALDSGQIEQSYDLGTEQTYPTVVELGQEFFGEGGNEVVIFTSSFYELQEECLITCLDGCIDCSGCSDTTIDIYMMSNYGENIMDISARKKTYTPDRTEGWWGNVDGIEGDTFFSVDVCKVTCKSIHLSLDLTNERSVGFNAQFLDYD